MVKLFVDTVELPNGKISKREIIKHNGAVAAVVLNGDNIILVKQCRYATGDNLLELPAGKIDPGENSEETIIRELEEEIGMHANKLTFLNRAFYAPGYSGEVVRIYLAEDLVPKQSELDSDELIEVVELPFEYALDRAMCGDFKDAKTTLGVLLAAINMGMVKKG